MGDFFGLLIIFFLMVYIYLSPVFRSEKGILTLIFVLLAVRVGIAAWNGFVGPTLGADSDALQFFEEAVDLKNARIFTLGSGVRVYSQFLGYFMWIGESIFLACILSVVAFTFSAKHLLDICDYIDRGPFKFHILLSFGLLPSMILFGSVMLRESFQILFFIFSMKSFITFYIDRKIVHYFLGILSLFLMGSLHEALLIIAILILPIITFFNFNKIGSWPIYSKGKLYSYILLTIVALTSFAILPFVIEELSILSALNGGDFTRYASNYRESLVGLGSRSAYDAALNFSSFGSFVSSTFVVLIHYLYYPFPWKVTGFLDIYAFIEVIWRGALIFFSFKSIFVAKGNMRRLNILLLAVYFIMALVWSSGTSNVGQSLRHNIVHYWILLVLGMPYLMMYLRRLFKT